MRKISKWRSTSHAYVCTHYMHTNLDIFKIICVLTSSCCPLEFPFWSLWPPILYIFQQYNVYIVFFSIQKNDTAQTLHSLALKTENWNVMLDCVAKFHKCQYTLKAVLCKASILDIVCCSQFMWFYKKIRKERNIICYIACNRCE